MKRFLICLTVVFMALSLVNCKTGGESGALPGGGKFNLSDLFGKGKGKITEPELGDIDTEFRNWESQDTHMWLPKEVPDRRIAYRIDTFTFGDIRIPKNNKLRTAAGYPVMVMIHGGAWAANNSLDSVAPLAEALTDFGIATWNIEFSRLGNSRGGYPGTFQDVGQAVDYLRTLAPEWNLDLSRVVVMGHSSGGHLALWVSSRHKISPSNEELYVADPLPIKGVVSLAGIPHLEGALITGGRTDVLTLHGFLPFDPPSILLPYYPSTSPYHMLPTGVTTSHIIGTEDNDWRIAITEWYVDEATTLGGEARINMLNGANHFDVIDPCGPGWPTIVRELFWVLGEQPPSGDLNKSKFCPVTGR